MSLIGTDKKEKKMKKAKKENMETPVPMSIDKKSKKESKKRKALDKDADAGDKENMIEPLNNAKPNSGLEVQKTKKKSKKAKVEKEEKKRNVEEDASNVVLMAKKKSKTTKEEKEGNKQNVQEEDENLNAVSQSRILQPLRAKLKERGIKNLSPIQAMTFDTVLDGFDLLAQAPAGQDKTLAFVLPILQTLINGSAEQSKKTGHRAPSAIVLLPTRDLAIQVLKEFGFYGGSLGLVSCCIYGGSSHKVQTKKLKRGQVDIIVGTPGRVKDHIDEGNIDLSSLKFRVLGEADELSKKGLVEHVEFILGKVNDVTKVQTLLFSTNMPPWLKEIAPSRYLTSGYKKVDLTSNKKMKAT
ncbi:DEAD-box ATP-dependent RNA helicase 7-like [Argentina anserina]|uniref:DEAD-box ATP-dependent RNA helicase 7-like n=1 Tax=Argentina anserina TaxID=57926 RepID=UPI0021763BC8|nr:DEAD-box ATP-dependent RNA helicase 7-like [Potentilla anserina]